MAWIGSAPFIGEGGGDAGPESVELESQSKHAPQTCRLGARQVDSHAVSAWSTMCGRNNSSGSVTHSFELLQTLLHKRVRQMCEARRRDRHRLAVRLPMAGGRLIWEPTLQPSSKMF